MFYNLKESIAQCPYDNTLYQTWAAPTTVGASVSATDAWGGDLFRVTGMIAGYTYEISTCASASFDTQLSIYTAGGGLAEGFNDDFCGAQSLIYFTPIVSGNYDILLDEYSCSSNTINTTLMVKLIIIPRPVITIPVVVHVVYKNATENITNAQIQSQIDVLNADFRRYNTDIYNAPAVFRGASYDPLIQFCLAQRDPNGIATNGITRTFTTTTFDNLNTSFGCDGSKCLFADAGGGKDFWNKSEYLNIWVCNITDFNNGLAGLALPASAVVSPSILQGMGVVLDYRAIGTIGSAIFPKNKGRTATHEIGHYLGLWHLWYQNDTPGVCQSDSVFDTPPQDEPTFNCPTASFPVLDGCSIVPSWGGIMFNNYMDYTNDNCQNMFTIGQSARMEAMLFNQYLSFQTSLGCQAATGLEETINNYNVHVFPNPNNGSFNINIEDVTNFKEFKIVDALGKVIYSEKNKSNTYTVNEFAKGIYFLVITFNHQAIHKKIIVN